MSRRNKVNPDHYTIAGRLAPDDLARERRKASERLFGATRGGQDKPMPPWMANESPTNGESDDLDVAGTMDDDLDDDTAEPIDVEEAVPLQAGDPDEAAQQPQAKPRRGGMGKQQEGGGNQKKTARRTAAARKQGTSTGTSRGARSAKAKTPSGSKASGATRGGGKAAKARGSAARAGSPQRAGKAKARKTASRGTQKATAKKGTTGGTARRGNKAKKAKKAKKR
jgi:hypothetical protein